MEAFHATPPSLLLLLGGGMLDIELTGGDARGRRPLRALRRARSLRRRPPIVRRMTALSRDTFLLSLSLCGPGQGGFGRRTRSPGRKKRWKGRMSSSVVLIVVEN